MARKIDLVAITFVAFGALLSTASCSSGSSAPPTMPISVDVPAGVAAVKATTVVYVALHGTTARTFGRVTGVTKRPDGLSRLTLRVDQQPRLSDTVVA